MSLAGLPRATQLYQGTLQGRRYIQDWTDGPGTLDVAQSTVMDPMSLSSLFKDSFSEVD